MTFTLEKEIQKMLMAKSPYSIAARRLLKKSGKYKDPGVFLSVCRFIYQAGLYDLLIETAIKQLKQGKVLPWTFIIAVMEFHKIKLPKKTRDFFIKGIMEQDQAEFLLTNQLWDRRHPELIEIKEKKAKQIRRKKNPDIVRLVEDLDFIQAQGVLKKEEEILKSLKQIDPHNPEVQEKWLKFQEKWGRDIIFQKKTLLLRKSAVSSVPPSEKEKKQVAKLACSIKTILRKNPEKSHDMALLFSFIGYPHPAIEILKDHINNTASQWLYLDLLLQSGLYVDCLNFVDIMEEQHYKDPETVFALTYARAKAYYGLGKKTKAKDILSDLLKVRPNYRLTHHILKQWEKGASDFD